MCIRDRVYSNTCLITAGDADGLHLAAGTATVVNCTFVNNGMNGIKWVAGAVAITNSIIWGHMTADLSGFGAGQLANVGYSAFAVPNTQHSVNGCITNNPLFVNAAMNDYRLQTKPVASLAINVGFNDLSWMTAGKDLDGQPRIRGGIIDMGAYETVPPKGTVFLLR